MPKIGYLGASMLRGNSTNFYIRCDDDLDDIDTDSHRYAEYPHIHVGTDGHTRWHNIVYIGITWGGSRPNIDIFTHGQYQLDFDNVAAAIHRHCRRISSQRVHGLTAYFFGYSPKTCYQ